MYIMSLYEKVNIFHKKMKESNWTGAKYTKLGHY